MAPYTRGRTILGSIVIIVWLDRVSQAGQLASATPVKGLDVSEAIYAMALLACPMGMGLMMWFMMRGGNHSSSGAAPSASSDAELASLRAEVDQLRAEQRDRDVSFTEFAQPENDTR